MKTFKKVMALGLLLGAAFVGTEMQAGYMGYQSYADKASIINGVDMKAIVPHVGGNFCVNGVGKGRNTVAKCFSTQQAAINEYRAANADPRSFNTSGLRDTLHIICSYPNYKTLFNRATNSGPTGICHDGLKNTDGWTEIARATRNADRTVNDNI